MHTSERYRDKDSTPDCTTTISVVVPALNEQDFIAGCITSVLAQRPSVLEVIVVDNNSQDATRDIVRSFTLTDSRVTLLHETRAGVAHARYTGFRAAQGAIIASIDSDTCLEPGWTNAVSQVFDKNENISAITAPTIMRDLPFQKHFLERNRRLGQTASTALRNGSPIRLPGLTGANCALRKTAWERVEHAVSTRTDIFEDLDLSLHLQAQGVSAVLAPGMGATVSGRRMLAGPRSFLAYAACGTRTYQMHGKHGIALAAIATNFITFIITMAKLPINRCWDPDNKVFSVSYGVARDREYRASPIG